MEMWQRLSKRAQRAVFSLFVVLAGVDLAIGAPLLSPELAYAAVALLLAPRLLPNHPVQDLLDRFADGLNVVVGGRPER